MSEHSPLPPLFCANHPLRETSLRCNRCEKPICPECAILTPTGYRCKECVRGHMKKFNTATWMDYPLAFVTAAILSYIGSLITGLLGFFTLILAPLAGIAIAEAVRFIIKKRRSPGLYLTSAAGTAVGSLPGLIIPLLSFVYSLSSPDAAPFLGGAGLTVIIRILYTILVTSSMYYRLTGTRLRL